MTNSQGLYWESGPYNSSIEGPAFLLEENGTEAAELIGEFLSARNRIHNKSGMNWQEASSRKGIRIAILGTINP